MADENGNEDSSPFEGFQTHEVDGKSLSTSEGSQQPDTQEESGDGNSTDTSEGSTDESGDDGSSQELDGSGVGDGEDTDADADDDHSEGEGDPGESEAEGEAADSGDDNEGEEGDSGGKSRKERNRQSAEKRIARSRVKAEQRANAAEARADALELRLARIEKGLPANDDGGSEESTDQGSDLKKPNPTDFDYGELDPAYVEALTDYRVDLRLEKQRETQDEQRQTEAASEQQAELQVKFEDKVSDGVDAYEDFDEVVVQAADNGEYPLTEEMAIMGLDSPVGHHVLYEIATDLPLAKKLAKLTPLQQAREFGRLEAQYTDDSGKKPKPNKTPQATPPPSGRKGAKGPKKINAASDNFADFEKMANAELARQPKRF